MLQHRTRAGVLPNPCNCGFLENQGLQRISLYVKSRFCLKTHVADSQRCRPAFAEAASRRQVQGFGKIPAALCGDFPAKPPSTPARFRYCYFCNWRVYGSWERGTSAQWTGLTRFLSTSFPKLRAKLLLLSAGEHDDEMNLVAIPDGFDEFIGIGAGMI